MHKTLLTAVRTLALALLLGFPFAAGAQSPCFGPAGCVWAGPSPYPPDAAPGPCFGDAGCAAQTERRETRPDGDYLTVWLTLPDGYAQAGISGPCWDADCPDLVNQAQAEAIAKLKNALRYRRWTETP